MGITLRNRLWGLVIRLIWGALFVLGTVSAGQAQTPLTLPFFDDFSTASGRPGIDKPDTRLWQAGSGVYINNTMAVNHPTVGVASFDGLRADGLPYVFNNQFAQGYTDTLASQAINLGSLTAADSVYLSFYWQMRGLGETPDLGDSLTVQFRNQAGNWQTVWRIEGGRPTNNFTQVFIPIRSAAYLHGQFAFRFRAYGRSSGPFDTWNIDYVYLNRGRTLNDRFVRDVAVRQPLSPLLKRYSAMPLGQYLVNPAAETADSVTTDINNLFNNFNFTTYRFTIRDEISGTTIQDVSETNSVLIGALSSQRKSIRPTPATGLGSATQARLRYKFDLLTTDDQNPSIPGVNLRQNDTLSGVANLSDYYAYDDGSWEYGLQIGPGERWAVRFVTNKADVISGVRACLVPFRTNQTGQSFVLSVYNNRSGRPNTVVYQQSFTVSYPPYRNAFTDLKFNRNVSVQDTFYIGYQQVSVSDTTLLRLGFDKNSPFGRQIFYNGGNTWEQNLQNSNATTLNFQGAFMLRPVMGGRPDTVVTALPEAEILAPLLVYPNPTTGLIRWETDKLKQIDVIRPTGQILRTLEPSRGQQTLDLGYLPDGLYLLRLTDDRRTVTQKVIIQH
jgi:hypothetical protein